MKIFGYNITRIKPKATKKRVYEAADRGRRGFPLRLAGSTSANTEVVRSLTTLRDRHRHLVRNNYWVYRAVQAIVNHTVGEGIRPAPTGSLKENKLVKTIWHDWAGTTKCDWYGKNNIYGLQALAMRSIVEGGDVVIYLRKIIPENPTDLPIRLQLLEGDFLDITRNGLIGDGIARMGVQYTKEGLLIGYWLWENHPGEPFSFSPQAESKFVSKDLVLHAFEVLRIGQARGVPFGVSALMRTSDLSDYEDAQLLKQKVAACMAGFITLPPGTGDIVRPENDQDAEVFDGQNNSIIDMMPGELRRLNEGETITFSDPPAIGDYEIYTTRILQGIAASYGITFEMLTMDYSRVNFTSGRMAKIDVTGNFKAWQYGLMEQQICRPVWEWFLDACIISGKLNKRIKTDWTAPRIQQLDPVKETNATISQLQAGLTTLSEVIRENGRDPEEFFEEYKQDVERLKSLGLMVSSMGDGFILTKAKSSANQNLDNNEQQQ